MGKKAGDIDEIREYGANESSVGKEVSNFSDPSSKKLPEFPTVSVKEAKKIDSEVKLSKKQETIKKAPAAAFTTTVALTLAASGTLVTTAVAVTAFSVDVKLFSANADSLVFEIEAKNLPEEEELFVELSNEEKEFYYDVPVTDERYYSFYDLEPSSTYTLKVYRNDKVEYNGIYKTVDEYVESAYIELMDYTPEFLGFMVFNPQIELHPILTVQAKQKGNHLILNEDTREEQSYFELQGFKPTDPLYITVFYLGTGLSYLYVEPLEEETREPEPTSEESSSEEPSEETSSMESITSESEYESSEEPYEDSSEESYEESSSEESYSESSEESITSDEEQLVLEKEFAEAGLDYISATFTYNDLEKAERTVFYLNGEGLGDIYFDSENSEISISVTGLNPGSVYTLEGYCDDNLILSMDLYTESLATIEAFPWGDEPYFHIELSDALLNNYGDGNYIYALLDSFDNRIYEDYVPTQSDGSDSGTGGATTTSLPPIAREIDVHPAEGIFTETYRFAIYLVDPTGWDDTGDIMIQQYVYVDGEERLTLGVTSSGKSITLTDFYGYYHPDDVYYVIRINCDNGYELEVESKLPEAGKTLTIDLETGGIDEELGSQNLTVESGSYTITIANDNETVYTSTFEVQI